MNDLDNILIRINKALKSSNINYPLGLVGSCIMNKKFNDIDLLLICNNTDLVKNKLINCFKDYSISLCDDAVKINDFCDKSISIALYSKFNVEKIINNFLTGKQIELTHRIWCLGYWIPESFIENIRQIKIINDRFDYMLHLKNILLKDNKYSKECIVKSCLSEIMIKYDLLKKVNLNSLEFSLYKNDIILSSIRGLTIINNKFLKSYKKTDELISELSNDYLNNFINGDVNSIESIIEELKNYVDWSKRLYLGTWQFSGDFKKLSENEIKELICNAKNNGINKFDTAIVYGNGNVEKTLSKYLDSNDIVLTKIPAKIKPPFSNSDNLYKYYDYEYILNCLERSCKNLKRDVIDICLLHNWTTDWNNNVEMISYLKKLKNNPRINKIGISLPNGFNNDISESILEIIDVIECPYNRDNTWIINSIDKYKKYGIEIILRSLFLQGKEPDKSSYSKLLENALKYNTSVVVGMTTKEQIENNVKVMKKEYLK